MARKVREATDTPYARSNVAYIGSPEDQRCLRVHCYSDRIQYCWIQEDVLRAADWELANFDNQKIGKLFLSNYLA